MGVGEINVGPFFKHLASPIRGYPYFGLKVIKGHLKAINSHLESINSHNE